MSREPELRRALEREPVPGAEEAEARAWDVVRAVHAERAPVRPARPMRRMLALGAAGAIALAIGLSPAGATVGDLVGEVGDAMGIGADDAKPSLRSLPAAGELLVESGDEIWLVRQDGSKRLLGDYHEAVWSPHGLYVAAAGDRELVVLEPDGSVRLTIPTPGRPADIRWAGSQADTRIAYRTHDDLHVVAGDGTGNHVVATGVAARPPVWIPSPLDRQAPSAFGHLLAYADREGRAIVLEPDSGARVDGLGSIAAQVEDELIPGTERATVERLGRRSILTVTRDGERRDLFSGPGRFTDPVWSPDGRWILVGWRDADQWVFLNTRRPREVVAFDAVTEQFDVNPGAAPGVAGGFPLPLDWIAPER